MTGEKRAERGLRVALTQSEGKLVGLEQGLLAHGFDVVRTPLIKTEPLLTPEVKRRAEALLACPWLLFTSPSTVEAWDALGLPLDGQLIGTVGKKTAECVARFGGLVSLVGTPQSSAGLAEAFLQSPMVKDPVGLPRGNRALPTLQDELERSGFETCPVVVYQTVELTWTVDKVDVVVLSSPSAVEALPREIGASAKLIALGPSTGAAISEVGWRYIQTDSPNPNAVIAELAKLKPGGK